MIGSKMFEANMQNRRTPKLADSARNQNGFAARTIIPLDSKEGRRIVNYLNFAPKEPILTQNLA